MVLDSSSGRVLLVYCRNNLEVFALNITVQPPAAAGSGKLLRLGKARDITKDAVAGLGPVQFVASGPPGGIRTAPAGGSGGRLVIAMDFVPGKNDRRWQAQAGHTERESQHDREASGQTSAIRSYVMHSDSVGQTWNTSGPILVGGNFSTSENQVATVDGGRTIITTARTQDFATALLARNHRAVSVSTDSGVTFGPFRSTNIPDPTCEGSTVGLADSFWMSSGFATQPGNRSNISLSRCDSACIAGGYVDWAAVLTVDSGLSSYSSLAAVGDNADTLLLLYEVGGGEDIKELNLVTIKLKTDDDENRSSAESMRPLLHVAVAVTAAEGATHSTLSTRQVGGGGAGVLGAAGSPPLRRLLLGSYLLADGDLFATKDTGISAAVQRPMKATPLAPLIKPDFPWEGTMHMYGSVVTLAPDDVRIYYACNMRAKAAPKNVDGVCSCCVAVSRDSGLTFTKPLLPFISYQNWNKTNM